jgi:16S rRNA (guanine527-N7)-methyltransferase
MRSTALGSGRHCSGSPHRLVSDTVTAQKGDPIEALAAFFGLPVPAPQRERLLLFFDQLLTWNARINLTGASSRAELLSEHLPDSFALARLIPPSSTLADIGSGGGLPALPFAILRPDVRLTLYEARAKRAAFLRTAIRTLHLTAVVAGRLDPATPPASRLDAASSRATFPPEEWLPIALPLVRPGGRVIVFTATAPAPASAARLVDTVQYETGDRHPRFAAAYCST